MSGAERTGLIGVMDLHAPKDAREQATARLVLKMGDELADLVLKGGPQFAVEALMNSFSGLCRELGVTSKGMDYICDMMADNYATFCAQADVIEEGGSRT